MLEPLDLKKIVREAENDDLPDQDSICTLQTASSLVQIKIICPRASRDGTDYFSKDTNCIIQSSFQKYNH